MVQKYVARNEEYEINGILNLLKCKNWWVFLDTCLILNKSLYYKSLFTSSYKKKFIAVSAGQICLNALPNLHSLKVLFSNFCLKHVLWNTFLR